MVINKIFWSGCHLNTIYKSTNKWNLTYWPPVVPSENHKVLYHLPLTLNGLPPKPHIGNSKWDANHVRLPSSHQSQYPVRNEDGSTTLERRWDLVQTALLQPILTSKALAKAIISYNTKYEKTWKFHSLHRLFEQELEEEESTEFFKYILPNIINLALQLPNLIPNAIPLLKQEQNNSISITQQQIGCLMANAFLCTFPRRNTKKKNSEYYSFPDINFNRLFQGTEQKCIEKLKCICNYFRRICKEAPTDVITFSRRFIPENQFPNWDEQNEPLASCMIHVSSKGTIEENGLGMLQVDFANRFIGGGVLGGGSVQEEIRFVICPELIVSRLFTESMKPTEALFIIGCEQFNKYDGYASSFTWNGNYKDETPLDDCRRRKCHIVAIDALRFIHTDHQFKEELMLRELKKAFVGYYYPLKNPSYAVASGNWGCGAYKGEAHLKFLIQLMVCCVVQRPLVYFTFDDHDLQNSIYEMYNFLCSNNFTVAEIWKYLKDFKEQALPPKKLYSFIYKQFQRAIKQETEPSFNEVIAVNKTVTKTKSDMNLKDDNISTQTSTTARKEKSIGTTIKIMFDSKRDKIINHFDLTNLNNTKKKEEDKLINMTTSTTAGPSQIKPSLLSCLDEYYNSNLPKKTLILHDTNIDPDYDDKLTAMDVDNVLINTTELKNNEAKTETECQTRVDDNLNIEDTDGICIDPELGEYVPGSPVTTPSSRKLRLNLHNQPSTSAPRQRKIFDFFK